MSPVQISFTRVLSLTWWALLLRGLFAIAFGLLIWFQPGISLAALILAFGAYVMADGLLGVWAAVSGRKEHEDWWILLLWGLVGIAVGTLTLIAPGLTALVLLFYIAIWAITTGLLEIVIAFRLRKEIEGEWLLILGGLASVVFGVLLIAQPFVGALAVLWLISIFAIAFGVFMSLLAFKVRKLTQV